MTLARVVPGVPERPALPDLQAVHSASAGAAAAETEPPGQPKELWDGSPPRGRMPRRSFPLDTTEWIRQSDMSLTSPRRDQRRRLLVAWTRSQDTSGDERPDPRPATDYTSAADPARQPGLAALVPTGAWRFALLVIALLVPGAAATTFGAWETVVGRPPVRPEGRFAATLGVIARCCDWQTAASLPAWIAHASLFLAAGFATAVRSIRRHRRDDYVGRYRAWGWLAALFVLASLAAAMPLGPLVNAALGDATGIRPGPAGAGWWVGLSTALLLIVSAWAILPLRERGATLTWTLALAMAWGVAAAGTWLTANGTSVWEHQVLATRAAWWLGCTFALVAMVAAARSVIRDVRGLVPPRATVVRRRTKTERPAAVKGAGGDDAGRSRQQEDHRDNDDAVAAPHDDADDAATAEQPDFTEVPTASDDEEEPDMRHLSKAEKKRLRKLRRQRAAA